MENREEEHSFWISYTDLITGFLIVFIVITLMLHLNIKTDVTQITTLEEDNGNLKLTITSQTTQIQTLENENQILNQDITVLLDKENDKDGKRRTENAKLKGHFKSIIENYNSKNIQVLEDGTIRFITGESDIDETKKLFKHGYRNPTRYFEEILSDFAIHFFDKVSEYEKDTAFDVLEIRIEGHADSSGDTLRNIRLSSNRAIEVYEYITMLPEYSNNYTDSEKQFFFNKTMVVGLGFSKRLDNDGQYVFESRQPEDSTMSRRVEFKILIEPI